MLKNFLLKKMVEKQMAGVPKDQQEMIMKMIQENPELFKKIGEEIQEEMKKGKEQMLATMEVMKRHQSELQKLK